MVRGQSCLVSDDLGGEMWMIAYSRVLRVFPVKNREVGPCITLIFFWTSAYSRPKVIRTGSIPPLSRTPSRTRIEQTVSFDNKQHKTTTKESTQFESHTLSLPISPQINTPRQITRVDDTVRPPFLPVPTPRSHASVLAIHHHSDLATPLSM